MRIVLDTGVFFHPAVLRELLAREEDVVVPAVTAAERVRQLTRDGQDVSRFFDFVEHGDILMEALTPKMACKAAARVPDDAKWRRLSRDALIAAHVNEDDELWTTNPRDFEELGVPSWQVVAVP